MSALYGYKKPWTEFPDWPARYDFVVKQPPSSAAVQDHIARADGRLSLVVRYVTAPPVKTGWADIRRSFRPPPVYFTSFEWRDALNQEQTCSREELSSGFGKLVSGYQELYTLACSLYAIWDVVPFVDPDGVSRTPTTEEQMNLERTFYPQVMRAATAWQEIRFKLYWEAEYMSQYLAYLSDLEDSGKLPAVWRPYPRPVTEKSVDRLFDSDRYCILTSNDRMDDFPFQMLRIIGARRKGEHWHTMKRLFEELLVPILNCKGYNGEEEVEKYTKWTNNFQTPVPVGKEYLRFAGIMVHQSSIKDHQLYRLLVWNHNPREYEKAKSKRYDFAHYDGMMGVRTVSPVLPEEAASRPPPYSQVAEGEATTSSAAEVMGDVKPQQEKKSATDVL